MAAVAHCTQSRRHWGFVRFGGQEHIAPGKVCGRPILASGTGEAGPPVPSPINEYTFDKKRIRGFPGLPLFLGSPGAGLETRSISFGPLPRRSDPEAFPFNPEVGLQNGNGSGTGLSRQGHLRSGPQVGRISSGKPRPWGLLARPLALP